MTVGGFTPLPPPPRRGLIGWISAKWREMPTWLKVAIGLAFAATTTIAAATALALFILFPREAQQEPEIRPTLERQERQAQQVQTTAVGRQISIPLILKGEEKKQELMFVPLVLNKSLPEVAPAVQEGMRFGGLVLPVYIRVEIAPTLTSTATPTPTGTLLTPTATPTVTQSPQATYTPPASPTAGPPPTATRLPTFTRVPPVPSSTWTPQPTYTQPATRTGTPPATATRLPTFTPVPPPPSPTRTVQPTYTQPAKRTETPPATATRLPTFTREPPPPTPTRTDTPFVAPTDTRTPTVTRTETSTRTATPTSVLPPTIKMWVVAEGVIYEGPASKNVQLDPGKPCFTLHWLIQGAIETVSATGDWSWTGGEEQRENTWTDCFDSPGTKTFNLEVRNAGGSASDYVRITAIAPTPTRTETPTREPTMTREPTVTREPTMTRIPTETPAPNPLLEIWAVVHGVERRGESQVDAPWGESFTIFWWTENVVTLNASGDWSGGMALPTGLWASSLDLAPGTYTYTLTGENASGKRVSATLRVQVISPTRTPEPSRTPQETPTLIGPPTRPPP